MRNSLPFVYSQGRQRRQTLIMRLPRYDQESCPCAEIEHFEMRVEVFRLSISLCLYLVPACNSQFLGVSVQDLAREFDGNTATSAHSKDKLIEV
jgi:hypothetical protein